MNFFNYFFEFYSRPKKEENTLADIIIFNVLSKNQESLIMKINEEDALISIVDTGTVSYKCYSINSVNELKKISNVYSKYNICVFV